MKQSIRDGDNSRSVNPHHIGGSGDHEHQAHAAISNDVAQTVHAVVTPPIGHQERLIVFDLHDSARSSRGSALSGAA